MHTPLLINKDNRLPCKSWRLFLKCVQLGHRRILGAAARECVQLGHCRILGAAAWECYSLFSSISIKNMRLWPKKYEKISPFFL